MSAPAPTAIVSWVEAIPAIIVSASIGGWCCLYGLKRKRTLKTVLAVVGFFGLFNILLASGPLDRLLHNLISSQVAIVWLIRGVSLLLALLAGVVTWKKEDSVTWLVAAVIGFLFGFSIFQAALGGKGWNKYPAVLSSVGGVIAGVIVAGLYMRFERFILVSLTALIGSSLLCVCPYLFMCAYGHTTDPFITHRHLATGITLLVFLPAFIGSFVHQWKHSKAHYDSQSYNPYSV